MMPMLKSSVKFSFLFILLSAGMCSHLHAQKKQIENLYNYDLQVIHFGFLLGVNNFNFTVKPTPNFYAIDSLYSITSEPALGFSLGIVSNLHLGDNFDLRFLPTLSFGERSMVYKVKDNALDSIIEKRKLVESTLMEFPLMMKFKSARYVNFRTYLIGGIKPTIDLASQDKVDSKGEKLLKLKRNDLHYELGVGFDFYSQYFKFSPELKFSFGMRDLTVQENTIYTVGLDRVSSRAIYISFLFE
jgi:hypothetical protein